MKIELKRLRVGVHQFTNTSTTEEMLSTGWTSVEDNPEVTGWTWKLDGNPVSHSKDTVLEIRTPGVHLISLEAEGLFGPTISYSEKFYVVPEVPVITTELLPVFTAGDHYSYQIECTGTRPLKWSCPEVPPGDFYLDMYGILHGTAMPTGTFPITITVTDPYGQVTMKILELTRA